MTEEKNKQKISDIFFGKADKVFANIRLYFRSKKLAKIAKAEKKAIENARAKLTELYGGTPASLRKASFAREALRAGEIGEMRKEKKKEIVGATESSTLGSVPKVEPSENEMIFVPLSEIAKNSTYSKNYINYSARQGKLRAKKIGGVWHTTEEWLAEFTEKSRTKKNEFKEKLSHDLGGNKKFVVVEEAASEEVAAVGKGRRMKKSWREIWVIRWIGVISPLSQKLQRVKTDIRKWFSELGEMEGAKEIAKLRKAKLSYFLKLDYARPALAMIALVLLMAVGNITKADLANLGDQGKKKIYFAFNTTVDAAANVAGAVSDSAGKSVAGLKIGKEKFVQITADLMGVKKVNDFEKKTGLALKGNQGDKENLVNQDQGGAVLGEETGVSEGSTFGAPKVEPSGNGRVLAAATGAGQTNVGDIEVSAYLMDDSNKEVPNGEYDVRFGIYTTDRTESDPYPSDADKGSRVWEETKKVTVEDGLLKTYLGDTTPLPESLNFAANNYYIGVRIAEDPEMVPRKRIGAVPLARTAMSALTAESLSGYTVGNSSGNIPVSNGTLNTNLNAEFLDGQQAGNFVTTSNATSYGYQSWKLQSSAADAGQKIKNNKGAIFTGANGVATSRTLSTLTIALDETSSPTLTGLTLSELTPYGVIYGNGTGELQSVTAGTEGQVLTYHADAAPTWDATPPAGGQYVTMSADAALVNERVLTGTANQIIITDGGANGPVTLSLPQSIAATDSPTFATLNLTTLDLGTNTITDGNLTGSWNFNAGNLSGIGTIGSGNITGGTYNGNTITAGTGTLTLNANTLTLTGSSQINQDLLTTSAPTFATLNTGQGANELYAMDQNVRTTDAVTFLTLNTGQGANELYAMDQNVRTADSPSFTGLTVSGLTPNYPVITTLGGQLTTEQYLDVTRGGTGVGTFAQYGVLYGNLAADILVTAAGTNGQIFTAHTGAAPTWENTAPAAPHEILSAQHSDTTSAAVQRGDLMTGQGVAPTWSRLAKGGANTFLRSDGTDLAWSTITLGTNTTGNYVATAIGTVDQVIVSGATGNVTFSLPQSIATTSAPTFATLNTGQGANELYAMDQNVRTSDSPTFATLNLTTLDLGTNTLADGNMNGSWDFNAGSLTNITALTTGTANVTTLDLGTNTIADGNMTGSWNFNSNALTNISSIDTINTSSTALTFTSTAPTISVSTAATAINLDAGTTGEVNIAGTSTGDINFGGGSAGGSGCTIDNTTGDLVCTGDITGGGTGSIGYWTRTGTTVSPKNVGDAVAIYANSANTSGTLLGVSYTANATLTGELIGAKIDLNDGHVTPLNQDVTGVRVVLPTTTNTNAAGTITYNGMSLGYGVGTGINQNGAGATVYNGASLLMPALTQTLGSLTANGVLVTTSSSITTGGTANAINITATGVGAGSLNGLNVSAITGSTGTERAISIGSGWDAVLTVNGATVVNGSGVVPATAGGTGLTSYAAGDIIYADTTTSFTNLAAGVPNNGKVLVVSGGVPTWGVMAGSSCTDCVLNDPTSVATQTITPAADISSLIIREAAGGLTAGNIFEVGPAGTPYFYIDKDGNVSTGGTASETLTLTPLSDTTALTLVGTNVPTASLQYINSKNTQGTILNMAYGGPGATTLAGALIGQKIDLSTNVTATNQSATGISVILPTPTNNSGTVNYKGLAITGTVGGGLNQETAGTTVFSGVDVTIPALTQTAGSLTANGVLVTTPATITTGGTANGISIAATGVGAGSLYGLNVSNLSGGAGAGAETAIHTGTGWDYAAIFEAGNVGIGTTTPSQALDVIGSGSFSTRLSVGVAIDTSSRIYVLNTNTSSTATNFGAQINNYTTAAITDTTSGIRVLNYAYSNTFTVNNSKGISIGITKQNANQTINNAYGLQIDDITAGTSNWSIYTGSAQSYFGGNVGIGTTSPGYKLSVSAAGSVLAQLEATDSNQSYLKFINSTTGSGIWSDGFLVGLDSDESTALWNYENTAMRFAVNNSEVMRLIGGNVGIGTTSPGKKLDVVTTLAGDMAIRATSVSAGVNPFASGGIVQMKSSAATGSLIFGAVTNDSFYIQSAKAATVDAYLSLNPNGGNVGIGTTSPSSPLHVVYNTSDSDQIVGRFMVKSTTGGAERGIGIRGTGYSGSAAGLQVIGTSNRFGVFDQNGTENLTILDSGNVGIGTTTPQNKLTVSSFSVGTGFGGSDGTGGVRVILPTSSYGVSLDAWDGSNPRWGITKFSVNTPLVMMEGVYSSNNVVFNSGGNVGIGDTTPAQKLEVNGRIAMSTWTADGDAVAYQDTVTNSIALVASDRRLKKNIVPLTGALNIVNQLNTYEYNDLDEPDGSKLRLGLMSQEVRPLIPELTFKFSKEGSSESYYGVHYDKLSVLLVGAMKEQQSMINEQGTAISQSSTLGEANSRTLGEVNLQITKQSGDLDSLQTAVNDKLNIVSGSLSSLNSRIADLSAEVTGNETDIASIKTRLASAETKLQTAENNLASFQTSTNDTLSAMLETENLLTQRITDHETRLEYLEAKMSAMTIVAGDIPSNVVTADASGNVDLTGILTAKGVVAGSYAVKNDKTGDAPTTGDDKIASGDDTKKISTKAVSASAKIFITFESDPGARFWIEKGDVDFTVKLSSPTTGDAKFSWWIVEEE